MGGGNTRTSESTVTHDRHASFWPIIGALGAGMLYIGLALVILATTAGVVRTGLGIGVTLLGGFVAVGGLLGWLWEAHIRPGGDGHPGDRPDRYVLTMLMFLSTDIGTFGAVFAYYGFIRVGTWPPADLPPILGSLVLVNTLILVTSSITFHAAHRSLHRGQPHRFIGLLGLTVLLGVIFLMGQAFEYAEFILMEGFTITSGVFASAFFGLTGLHGLHVLLGVIMLGIVLVRAIRGHYSPDRDTSVTTVGLYWHFVDGVWIILVVVLYVGATITV